MKIVFAAFILTCCAHAEVDSVISEQTLAAATQVIDNKIDEVAPHISDDIKEKIAEKVTEVTQTITDTAIEAYQNHHKPTNHLIISKSKEANEEIELIIKSLVRKIINITKKHNTKQSVT